jgi:HD-GYP domain-containing protein (c-di-GMP phosphodiesterase class II)
MSKTLTKIRVESSDLAIGMYVCELDRPWLESPFLIQGFYLKDIDDIDTVRQVCKYVYIDKIVAQTKLTHQLPGARSAILASKRVEEPGNPKAGVRMSHIAASGTQGRAEKSEQSIEYFFPQKKLTPYADSVDWRGEIRNARRAIKYLYDYIFQFMTISAKGNRLDLQHNEKAVAPMVESVIRNPDACLWWIATRPVADYIHDSALRSSVFAVVLGRQLGLPKSDLYRLAIGGLLFDVGKLRLDDSILRADRKLTAPEMALMQSHVEIGLDLLERSGLQDPDIIDFIANHHERLDGSGYPRKIRGDDIPAFGRIAGLVDCYNAMTSSRGYANEKSPAEAITQLYQLKGVHFHTDLVEEFIHAIGVYPVGAMVELSSAEVAIVVAQSRTRRLRPVVMLLLDDNKNPGPGGRYIELETSTHLTDGCKLDIVKNLAPGTHGIDMAAIRLKA